MSWQSWRGRPGIPQGCQDRGGLLATMPPKQEPVRLPPWTVSGGNSWTRPPQTVFLPWPMPHAHSAMESNLRAPEKRSAWASEMEQAVGGQNSHLRPLQGSPPPHTQTIAGVLCPSCFSGSLGRGLHGRRCMCGHGQGAEQASVGQERRGEAPGVGGKWGTWRLLREEGRGGPRGVRT